MNSFKPPKNTNRVWFLARFYSKCPICNNDIEMNDYASYSLEYPGSVICADCAKEEDE